MNSYDEIILGNTFLNLVKSWRINQLSENEQERIWRILKTSLKERQDIEIGEEIRIVK